MAGNLLRSGQNPQGDWQIKAPAFLGQVGRCQIDRHVAGREIEAAVDQRGAHPMARLAYLRFRQSDDGKAGQAIGQMHFNTHQRRVKAVQRA